MAEGRHRATPDGSPRSPDGDDESTSLTDEHGNRMTSAEVAMRQQLAAEVVPMQAVLAGASVPIFGRTAKSTPSVSMHYNRTPSVTLESSPGKSVEYATAVYNAKLESSTGKSVNENASVSATASMNGESSLIPILKKSSTSLIKGEKRERSSTPKKVRVNDKEDGNKELHVMSETLLPGEERSAAEEAAAKATDLAKRFYESLPAARVAKQNRDVSPSRRKKIGRKRTTRNRDFGARLDYFLKECKREYEQSGRLMPIGEVKMRMQALRRRKVEME